VCADADKRVVLRPGRPELVPAKPLWDFSTIAAPDAASGLMVLADEHRAIAHFDPAAALDLAAEPVRHHLRVTSDEPAIDRLLQRFGLGRLRPLAPREQITPELVASMLKTDLGRLRSDLPRGVRAEIQPEDIQFAMDTIRLRAASGHGTPARPAQH
jgi:hypothetical protein